MLPNNPTNLLTNSDCSAFGFNTNCCEKLRIIDDNLKQIIVWRFPDNNTTFNSNNKLCTNHWSRLVVPLNKHCILPNEWCMVKNNNSSLRDCSLKLLTQFKIPKNGELRIHKDCYVYYNNNPTQSLGIFNVIQNPTVLLTEEKKEILPNNVQSNKFRVPQLSNLLCDVNSVEEWKQPLQRNFIGTLTKLEGDLNNQGFLLIPKAFNNNMYKNNATKQQISVNFFNSIKHYTNLYASLFSPIKNNMQKCQQIALKPGKQKLTLLDGWEFIYNGWFWQRKLTDKNFESTAANYARDLLVSTKSMLRNSADKLKPGNMKLVIVPDNAKEQWPHMDSSNSNAYQVIIYTSNSISTQFAFRTGSGDDFSTGCFQWRNMNYWKVNEGDIAIFTGTTVHAGSGPIESSAHNITNERIIIFFTLSPEDYTDDKPIAESSFKKIITDLTKPLKQSQRTKLKRKSY